MTIAQASAVEDPIFAMIRAAGMPGFKRDTAPSAKSHEAGSGSVANSHLAPSLAAVMAGLKNRPDDAEPVLTLVRVAGLAGFKPTEVCPRENSK